jgi:hypothetical protein
LFILVNYAVFGPLNIEFFRQNWILPFFFIGIMCLNFALTSSNRALDVAAVHAIDLEKT